MVLDAGQLSQGGMCCAEFLDQFVDFFGNSVDFGFHGDNWVVSETEGQCRTSISWRRQEWGNYFWENSFRYLLFSSLFRTLLPLILLPLFLLVLLLLLLLVLLLHHFFHNIAPSLISAPPKPSHQEAKKGDSKSKTPYPITIS